MFVRNLYDKDIETKYFEPLLAEIERIRSGLASMPTETSLNFIKNSAMQRWLEEKVAPQLTVVMNTIALSGVATPVMDAHAAWVGVQRGGGT